MTGAASVIINTAAQSGVRAAVGPARVGEPNGFDLLLMVPLAVGGILIGAEILFLAIRGLWPERRR